MLLMFLNNDKNALAPSAIALIKIEILEMPIHKNRHLNN